ncbi:hypothetical protein V8F33_005945 [Rhypophila sp. PSN 637]
MVFRSWRRSSKELDWDSDSIRKLEPSVIANLPIEYLQIDCVIFRHRLLLASLATIWNMRRPRFLTVYQWKLFHGRCSLLAELAPETLKRLPPDILSELAPTTLATLPPETLSSVMFKTPSKWQLGYHINNSRRDSNRNMVLGAQLTVPGQLGRSKSLNNPVPSMQGRNSGGAQNTGPSTRFPRIDNNARIAQKRASYRHLRHPSREETLHATTVPGSGISIPNQASRLQVLPPLEAVVAEAKNLRRVPQDRRSRSDGVRRSPSFSEPAQRFGPVPPPKRPLSPDRAVPISSQRHSPNAALPRDESRVPSSGSHKSVQRQRRLGQRLADGKPEQGAVEEAVDAAERSLSFDPRATPTRLSDGLGSSNKEADANRSHETQLEISLRERDKLIVELQEARDHQTSRVKHYMAQSTQADRELKRQKDDYEKQLADIRNKLAGQQARQEQNELLMSKSHEEKLKTQENSHQQRTKQLKLKLLDQKSNYDKRLHEARDKLQAELGMVSQELYEAKRQYEAQLEGQKIDAVNEKSTQDQETEKRVAQHQAQLASLQQKHKTNIDALSEKLSSKQLLTNNKVAILNGQPEDQDADYRLQIAQLIESMPTKYKSKRKTIKLSLPYRITSLAHIWSTWDNSMWLKFSWSAITINGRCRLKRITIALLFRSRAWSIVACSNSLRAESGDYLRQASDDKLEGMFRQLKVAVEVVAEPLNLGLVVIQPGGSLDPTGILAPEKGIQRHLLRSLVWSKIADGSFSAPFGFGVLGSEDGKQMLFELFMQWRKLLPACQSSRDGLPQPQASDAASLDLYDLWRDRENNRWRSATFQSILTVVTARRETNLPYQEAKPAATNGQVGKEIEDKVDKVTFLAAELALEIGVHRAYLGLRFPKQCEKVAIGRDSVVCEDGDPARGLSDEVELVVCPQFVKIGDGRSDLTTSKSIFRGEIYPVRSYEDDACS